ncbi:hypothetical protein I5677_15635 [Mobilitalea sibirica]|uniref:DUF6487 domain-containing protein n=1 Tax=Mobilitalea sibirica TaxID=1462919 RepID=A0A8J7L0G7_9FIRM|nr:PF20097 family protein [Mobilitalea sibirica]MBH1942333.1 hypothetical protein [Mobilitalea sibirica]
MECPYYKSQMKLGAIDVYDTLSWSPDGETRKGHTKHSIAKNGLLIAKYFLIQSASKEAFY